MCTFASPVPIGLAHRGGWLIDQRGQVRTDLENTAAAFEHAVRLGYRYLETDVRATADGVLVAFHDPVWTGSRIVPARSPHCPRLMEPVSGGSGSEQIPLLEDLLGSLPDARFNIDVKADLGRRTAGPGPAPHQRLAPGVRGLLCRARRS